MNITNIYILNNNILAGKEESILSRIAPHYVNKYEKAKVAGVKKDELGAGYLLAKYLGITRDEQLVFSKYGKPGVADGSCEFSLSHSGEYVVLAVSGSPVGVDIERIDRLTLDVLRRVLPVAYYEELEKIESEENRQLEMAKSWTVVEAILKAEGKGFSIDPREYDNFMNGWQIESFSPFDNYMISLASRDQFQMKIIHVE